MTLRRTSHVLRSGNMKSLFPQRITPALDIFHTVEVVLEQCGCIARRHGEKTLEVWEVNLSEHYLLTLDHQQPPRMDIIQLDGV